MRLLSLSMSANRILIIGPLGAGKSTLAYELNKRYHLSRLNLDEVARNPKNGDYYSWQVQEKTLHQFLKTNTSWVIEGCQKSLYEQTNPNLIVDMRISPLVAVKRFTLRFIKAKRLIGKRVDKNAPVQAYHYRKLSIKKILEYNAFNRQINQEIKEYLSKVNCNVVACKGIKDYNHIFKLIQ